MNNLAILTAQPQKMVVDGKEYVLHPLTFDDYGKLQAWIDEQSPDPFDIVNKAIAKGNYTIAQQQYLLRTALEKATQSKKLIGTPDADELLMTVDGYKQVLLLSIRKGNPDFTETDAEKLYMALSRVDIEKVGEATTLSMVANDPKEPPLNVVPPRKPSGSATSRRGRRAAKKSTGGASGTSR